MSHQHTSLYTPSLIEKKWQDYWEEHKTFASHIDPSKPKYYILDMFPYPSGAGLHVGHPEGYTATDIVARFKRMKGFNVLHPMGWDAFGLPAERAALRDNTHPAVITQKNIATFKRQIKALGLSYDWSREILTSDPSYYKWTQWIFLKIYEKGLAYLADVPVNWCPAQGTVLANEEVVDGRYVETGDPVEKRVMRQWMLRITDYAERLLEGLSTVDWPLNVVEMQKNWIGKSSGMDVCFSIEGSAQELWVFTTRPETLFGVTFCAVAPEHPLLEEIVVPSCREAVQRYCQKTKALSDKTRQTQAGKTKTGVPTGAYALHPLTGDKIPIWVADYVRHDYGWGAVMGVPGHDLRDEAFATTYRLPLIKVINEGGALVASREYNGLKVQKARQCIGDALEKQEKGTRKTTYKLRDWLFSRQRYWGEPFPVVYDNAQNVICLSEKELPLVLPDLDDFHPTKDGAPPLGRATHWAHTSSSDHPLLKRELNTMPQWAGSCWYYLRYMDPSNSQKPFDPKNEQYWGQVDLYVGGLEHAVSHLLYARFWHKVLFDCGLVSHDEPFKKLFNQGMILGVSYRDAQGKYYPSHDVVEKDGAFYSPKGLPLTSAVEKMSKSKLNVTNPDDVVKVYGADSLRLYEMFMGPLEATKPWQTKGVKGVNHFLKRLWRLAIDEKTGAIASAITPHESGRESCEPFLLKAVNRAIFDVTNAIEALKFNTAISHMMTCLNVFKTAPFIPQHTFEKFILILSPFAPHIAEELWQRLGHKDSLAYHPWPCADTAYLAEDRLTMVFCINGKKVFSSPVADCLSQEAATKIFQTHPKTQERLAQNHLEKIIFVPKKLFNAILSPGGKPFSSL